MSSKRAVNYEENCQLDERIILFLYSQISFNEKFVIRFPSYLITAHPMI